MTTSDWIIALNGVAILLAPVVALWIGGILQRRSDSYKAKLLIFDTLMGLRHVTLSPESTQALNRIDAVFADNPPVREAWTRYYTALNDSNMNAGPGFSIREEKRRELLLEIVKALKLNRKISSADLLRTYTPTFIAEDMHVTTLERIWKRAVLEGNLTGQGLVFPQFPIPQQHNSVPPPVPQPTAPSAGNGAEPPQNATGS